MFTAFASEPPTAPGGSTRRRGLGAALAVILAPALALSALVAVAPLPVASGAPGGPTAAHAAPERQVVAPDRMTMTGRPNVGRELSIDLGQWTPVAGLLEKSYSWYRNGVLIPGEDQPTYTPVSGDFDQLISAKVFGSYGDWGFASSETNKVRIVAGTLDGPDGASITGEIKVGQKVTALVSGLFQPQPVNLNYEWFYGNAAVPNSDSAEHVIRPEGVGRPISVRITGSKQFYDWKTIAVEGASLIGRGTVTETEPARLTGDSRVGGELTVVPPQWNPQPSSFTYVWMNDAEQTIGTGSTYIPRPLDVGTRIRVRATGVPVGYNALIKDSGSVEIRPGQMQGAVPTISGTTRVGNLLTAERGSWLPAGTSFSYQWRINGANIPGATSRTYTPVTQDAGKEISVAVTGTSSGYQPLTLASSASMVNGGVFRSVTPPQIMGTLKIGEQLTVAPGTWDPAPSIVSFEWLRNGQKIATGTSYTPTLDDAGKLITVREYATRGGFTTGAALSAQKEIPLALFTSAPIPTIRGDVLVGSKLTVQPGTWTPVPAQLSYQWLADGLEISGATAAEYTPTTAQIGKAIRVRVTASRPSYRTTSLESVAATVPALLDFTSAPSPVFSGTAKVGSTVTAFAGSWAPAPAELRYQWLRDGIAISGATETTYTPAVTDQGKQLSVQVTGSRPGYRSAVRASGSQTVLAADPVLLDFTTAPTPIVVGTAKVGAALTAQAGFWAPAPDALAYQWLRDGAPISGATTTAYTPVVADQGRQIAVRVTASKTGYRVTAKTSTSQTVAAPDVDPLDFTSAPTPTLPAGMKIGVKVVPAIGAWVPAPDALAYQWLRDDLAIPGATLSSYTPGSADAGKRLSLRVTASKTGYKVTAKTSASQIIDTTEPGSLEFTTAPMPTLPAGIKVGVMVVPSVGTWVPEPDALAYQWLRDGIAIPGATGASHTPSVTDEGKQLALRVTASKDGYRTTAMVSVAQQVGPATGTELLDFTITPTPTIAVPGGGAAKVGKTVTAVSGIWAPTPDVLAYQWLREGAEIPTATSVNYTPAAADEGKRLSVRVAVGKTGYRTASKTSAEQTVAAADPAPQAFPVAPIPGVTGSARVHEPLSASPGDWSPVPEQMSYQWLRDGVPIPAATSAKYVLIAADEGRQLSVRVTASKAGYQTTERTSDTRLGLPAQPELQSFTTAPRPTIPADAGRVTVGERLALEVGAWAPEPDEVSIRWERNGVPIPGSDSTFYTPVAADAGQQLTAWVTASKTGYLDTTRVSLPVTVVPEGTELPEFESAPSPTISGSMRVDSTVTAAPGAWAPVPDAFAYQWLRDGDPIPGAISSAYTPVASDQGKQIAVRVTATHAGYRPTSATSAQQLVIASDPELANFIEAPSPVISVAGGGEVGVGSKLAASPGPWAPQPDVLAYQWERSGAPIVGANSASYTPVAADAGKQLRVWVTASKTGYRTAMRVSDARAVRPVDAELLDFTAAPNPTISGTVRVESTVTAAPGEWAPDPDAFSYQWLRNGMAIAGAKSSAYTPVAADENAQLSVRVTASKDGYRSQTKTSAAQLVAASDPGLLGFTTAPNPTMSAVGGGPVKVGAAITASAGAWTPQADSFAYQWERNGIRIPGADAATYVPKPADAGALLSVWVTASKAGYRVTTRVSAVEQVLPADTVLLEFAEKPKPSISGAVRVDSLVSAAPGEWLPDPDAFAFQWLRDGEPVPGATSAAYLPLASDQGKKLSVRVTAIKAGYQSASRISDEQTVAEPDPEVLNFTSAPTPTIEGRVQVGKKLTAQPGAWAPDPDVLAYQWLRNGGSIPGANEPGYTPVADDEGKQLSVRVTAMKADYRTTSKTSEAQQVAAPDPEPLDFTTAPIPTVAVAAGGTAAGGAVKVGARLTALPGVWEPVPGEFAYQWLRSGAPITGAVFASYTPVTADLGKQLSVRVTATKTGYRATVRVSTGKQVVASAPVVKRLTSTPKPKISGTARVGKKLSVRAGSWKPAKVSLSYRWLRNGKAIKGATKSKYKLTRKDRGKRISVRVTGKKSGYVTVSRVSSAKRVR